MNEIWTTSLDATLPKRPDSQKGKRARKGQVKPVDRERCPVCGESFLYMGSDWGCPAHLTRPRRYQIQLYWPKHGLIRVYSDRAGNPLDSYERAHQVLEVMRSEIAEHKFDASRYSRTEQKRFQFKRLAEEWLVMQERRLNSQEIAPTHFRNVRTYVLQRFIPFFGSEDIREIRKKRILEFKECLGDQLSLKTVRNILSCLHSMFAFWVDVEMLEKMPRFPGIRILDPESWSWADEETQLKILSKVPDRDRPIFYFTCFQGVRPSESRAVQWRDLNLREGTVRIRRTWSKSELRLPKGKRERILPLDPEVQSMIEKMQRPLDPEAFVFQRNGRHYSESYCRKLWNRICKELSIKGLTFYDGTRHSLASQYVSDGGSLNDVKEFLGHTDIRTTLKYAHADLRAMQRVIARRKVRILKFRKHGS